MYDKLNAAMPMGGPGQLPEPLAEYEGDQGGGKFGKDTIFRLLGIPITITSR